MKKRISLFLACVLVVSLSATVIADNGKTTAELAEAVSLPAALIAGDDYELTPPQSDMILFVNGQICEGSFVAEGAQMTVAYTTADGTAAGEYTLPVVDTDGYTDQTAYFYDPDGKVSGVKNENEVTLSVSQDAQTSFIKKLSAEDLPLYLTPVAGKTNFEQLILKLTDGVDARVSVTFTVDMATATVSCGSASAELGEMTDTVKLRYKNGSGKLFLDEQELLSVDTDDKGDAFNGFSSGVYVTVGFAGVSGSSAVNINRLSNQPFGHKNGTAADITEPVLAITSALIGTQYMGDEFNIPSIEIYDVLSQIKETTVKVEAPDGTEYTEAFTITQYGKYKLTFIAKDTSGNTMKTTRIVFVNDDVAPELTVSEMEKTTYKVGDAVSVPTYTVSDNMDAALVDVILILPNYEIRLLTHEDAGAITFCLSDTALYSKSFVHSDSAFIAQQTGVYTIRYVAYDDQYNRTVLERTFTVE